MDGQKRPLKRVKIDTGVYEHYVYVDAGSDIPSDAIVMEVVDAAESPMLKYGPAFRIEHHRQTLGPDPESIRDLLAQVEAVRNDPVNELQLGEAYSAKASLEILLDLVTKYVRGISREKVASVHQLVFHAFHAGAFVERMHVRGQEHHAAIGKTATRGSIRGGLHSKLGKAPGSKAFLMGEMKRQVKGGQGLNAASKDVRKQLLSKYKVVLSADRIRRIYRLKFPKATG